MLEYFDAYLIGLTATPAKHTFGFFNQNLVMEYSHERAVADGVNVDFEVYHIRTKITEQGSTIEAEPGHDGRLPRPADARGALGAARRGRHLRAERPGPQRRAPRTRSGLIVRTFRDRLFTEIFPGRTEVPKTLIFAKDDSHAEDIVEIVREEFGRGQRLLPEDHLQDHRREARAT